MAKKPDFVRFSAVALYADEHQMRRVNRFSADASFQDEDILELSNNEVAEHVDDIDTVSVTIDCHEFGSVENMAKATNFFQTGDTGAKANKHYITDSLFDNACVDFMLKVTSGTHTDALAATCWYGSQWLTGYTASYSADGMATESYSFEGDYKRWFLHAYRDAYVFSGTYTNATTATIGANLTGYTARVLTVNNIIQSDVKAGGSSAITISAGATSTVTAKTVDNADVSFKAGDRVRVVCAKTAPASFASLPSTPAGIGALRRGMIDIYMYGASGNEEKTLRLQSVNLNVGLDRTGNAELGSKHLASRSLNRPISVEVSCEALYSDLEEYAKMADKETEFDAMSLNEIDIDDFSANTTVVIKVYKSETNHSTANLLKTITLTGLSITSDGFSVDAGNNSTSSFNLKGSNFCVQGGSISPIL
jgi:hypothetical protein